MASQRGRNGKSLGEMSSYGIHVLDSLEIHSLKNSVVERVQSIKLELMFLKTFNNWIPYLPSDEFYLRKRTRILKAYLSINDEICRIKSWHGKMKRKVSGVLKTLKHIKLEVNKVYDLYLGSAYPPNCWIYQTDHVVGFINDLLENLKDLVRLKAQIVIPFRKQIEDLKQALRFLRDLTRYTEKRSKGADEVKYLMVHVRTVTDSAAILSYSCLVEAMDNGMARGICVKFSDLLQRIKPVNPEVQQIYSRAFKSLYPSEDPWTEQLVVVSLIDFLLVDLIELIHHHTNLKAPKQDQIEILHEEMIFLKAMIMDPPEEYKTEKFKYLIRNIDEVIFNVGFIVYSFSTEETEDHMASKRNAALLHLRKSINLIIADIKKINLYSIPSTDELRSVDFFLENLEELLTHGTDSIAPMKNQCETVHTELLYLRLFLDKIKKWREEHNKLKGLWKRVIVVAYQAEHVIDLIVIRDGPVWHRMLQLSAVIEEIKLIKTEIEQAYDKKAHDNNVTTVAKTSSQVPMQETTSNIDDIVVGFEDEAEAIMEQLIGTRKNRDVIAIVGMPGLGKTTLAKKLYHSPSVEQHFHVRSWCCVSQTYQKKDLLLDILGDVIELTDRIYKMSEDDLAAELYRQLKGRRYLLVLDDIWDIEAWNALERSFHDDKKGSRIMITSRMYDEPWPCNKIHPLRRFSDDECWKLLQAKLFHKEDCPKELSEIGKQIAKNCKGLPLAVVLAAGLLTRIDMEKGQWKQIAKSLSSHIVNDTKNQCKDILELSYKHLPAHLRSCFLYFGGFPEDQEIPVQKLIWLWIAEGFVKRTNSKSLEDVAEDYLTDLIGRSLVMGAKIRSKGGHKACQIHDLLRDFCLAKAEEENFLKCIRGYDELFPSPVVGLDYGVDSDHSDSSSLVTYKQYRLSIYSRRKHFVMACPLGPSVRSLSLYAVGDMYPNYPYNASFISRNFKLIRVLDLECINIGDSLGGIELLVHLRYLAVRGDIESIPSSIANLRSLEIFVLKGLRVEVVLVPDSIWNMVKLRHLHINDRASFDLNHQILQNSFLLDNLESFSTPSLAYGDDVEKLLRRLPNLRKLRCIFLGSWDYFSWCYRFPVLSSLSQLESLKVSGDYKVSRFAWIYPCEFNFPSNLRKLTLSEFCLPWSEISSIGRLPNLEVLKLLCRAFEGKLWDMKDGEFLKLKYLKLEFLNIVEWKASNDHIPHLERLVLRKCKNLREIPPSFADIDTLEMIEVQWCSHSAANSAKIILEERNEYGTDSLKVNIYPKEKHSDASS